MTTVELQNLNISEILSIVYALRDSGLQDPKDFTFSYSPSEWITTPGTLYSHRKTSRVKFTFDDDSNATWFVLRWGGDSATNSD